jgi:hypothetical protein
MILALSIGSSNTAALIFLLPKISSIIRLSNIFVLCVLNLIFNSAESLVLKESIESTHMTIKYGIIPVMSDDATVLYTDIVKCSTPWDAFCCRSY